MSNIEPLARDWITAKKAAAQAAAKVLKAETDLIEALGFKKEGAETHEAGSHKVTITGKLTRSLDVAKWDKVKDNISRDMWPISYKPSVDVKGVKYLMNNEPDTWLKISEAFTTKPAKTSVAVKEF